MTYRHTLLASLAMLMISATATAQVTQFRADLITLNAGAGANVSNSASGTATLTLDQTNPTMPTLRVQINATGLEDLDAVGAAAGLAHAAHIHGQFQANLSVASPLDMVNGPFFQGEGGTSVDSILPSLADDGAKNIDDGFLDFFEGLPDYGPVVLNLTSTQVPAAPDGVPPLVKALQFLSDNGLTAADVFPRGSEFNLDTTYSFDLTDQDSRRQFNNLMPLEEREIVLHGLTVSQNISNPLDDIVNSDAFDAPQILKDAITGVPDGNGNDFRTTAPVAAGEIVLVPEPAAAILLIMGLAVVGFASRRRR